MGDGGLQKIIIIALIDKLNDRTANAVGRILINEHTPISEIICAEDVYNKKPYPLKCDSNYI